MREIASGESSQKNRSGEQEKKKPRDGGYSSEQLDDDTKKQNLGLEFGRDYKNLSAAITQLQKQVKDLEGRINSKQEEIKNKESEMKKINAFFDEMPIRQKRGGTYRKFRQEKKKYQEEIAELKKSKETLLTAAIQRLEEKNKNKDSSKKCDDIQTEINSLDNKINKQRKALNKDGSELAKINAQRQDLEKQLFELSQKSQVPQDLLKKDLTSLTEESTELQTELQNLRTKMTDVEKNKRVLEQQRNSDTNRLKNINMLRENKSSDIGLLKTALSQIDNLEKKNLKREQRAKRLDESLDKLQRDQEICQKIIEGQEKVLEYLNWKKQGLEKLKKIYPQNDEVYKYLENDIKHYNTEIEQFEGDKASSQRKLERIKKELDLKTRNLQSDYRAYDNFEAWYDLNKKNLERIKPYDPKRFEALEKELLLLDNENEAIKGKEISIKEEIIITKSYSITNKLLLYPFHENSYNKHRENLVSYYKLGSTEKHRNFDSKSYPTIREDKIGRRVMKLTSEEENLKEEYDQIQTKIINLFRREYGKQWLSPITNLFSVFSTKLGVQKTDHLAESRSEALSHSDDQHSPAMSPQITKNILSNEAPTNDQRNSFNPAIYSYAKQLLALEDQLIENRREYYTLKDYVVNKKIQGIETHEQTFKKFQTKKRNFDNNIKNVINEIIQNDEIRKKDIKEIPQRLESYQTAIAEAAQRLESYQTAIAEAAQRLKSYQTAIAEITQRQQWQERVGTFTSEETALSSKIQQLEQEKQQIEDIKTELEQKQKEMDVINGRIIQLHKNQELQKSSLQTAKDEMKILEEQHRRRLDLEGELATAKQELTQSREELERAKDALQEALDKEVRHLPTTPKIWTDEQIAHSKSQDARREQVEAILLKSLSSDLVRTSMAEAKIEAQTSYGYKLDNSIPREKREVSLAKIIRLKKEYEQRLEKEQIRLSEQNAAISVLEQLLKVPREQKSAEIETKKIELENLEKSIDRLEQRSFVSIEKSNAFSKSQTIVSSTYEKLLGSVNKTQKSNFEDPAESQSSEIISPELLNSLGQMHIQKQLMKDAREYNLSKHEKAEVQLEQRAKKKNNLIQNIEKLEKEYDELIGPLTNSQREKQQTLQEIDQIKSRIELFASVEHLHNAQINFSDKVIGEGTKASSHLDTAIHLTDQAGLCYAQGAYKWAELLLKQALQVREEHLGPNHPDTASSLYNLAGTYRAQGKYEQAELLSKRALQIFGQLLQAQHPEQVGRKEDAQVTGHDEQAKPEQIDKLLSEVKKAIGNYKHLIKKVV